MPCHLPGARTPSRQLLYRAEPGRARGPVLGQGRARVPVPQPERPVPGLAQARRPQPERPVPELAQARRSQDVPVQQGALEAR